jgi:hypothetical protein
MTKRQAKFFGTWVIADGSSSVIYEIGKGKNGVLVRGVDQDDGEELVVSNVRWRPSALEFETFVRSTGSHFKHRLVSKSRNRIEQELTTIEHWKRIGRGQLIADASPRTG